MSVIISGGSRGIGLATARRLAQSGKSCVLLGRDEERVRAAAASLGSGHLGLRCDVGHRADCDAAVQAALNTGRPIEGLVHCAGVTRNALLLRDCMEEVDALLRTNVVGALQLTQSAAKSLLRSRERASIVFVGSVVGEDGNAGQSAYAASKAAVAAAAKSLAKELGSRGVRVNTVAPGFIDTDMTAGLSDERRDATAAATALRRLGSADEVAAAIAFLLSDDASFITGTTLRVDGGLRL